MRVNDIVRSASKPLLPRRRMGSSSDDAEGRQATFKLHLNFDAFVCLSLDAGPDIWCIPLVYHQNFGQVGNVALTHPGLQRIFIS